MSATLTTEISWKGETIAMSQLGIEQLEDLADDIDYADYQLTRRFQRDNLNSREYRKLLNSNDEVRETVKAELARRGYAVCSDCNLLLSIPGSEICPSCNDLAVYVD